MPTNQVAYGNGPEEEIETNTPFNNITNGKTKFNKNLVNDSKFEKKLNKSLRTFPEKEKINTKRTLNLAGNGWMGNGNSPKLLILPQIVQIVTLLAGVAIHRRREQRIGNGSNASSSRNSMGSEQIQIIE